MTLHSPSCPAPQKVGKEREQLFLKEKDECHPGLGSGGGCRRRTASQWIFNAFVYPLVKCQEFKACSKSKERVSIFGDSRSL